MIRCIGASWSAHPIRPRRAAPALTAVPSVRPSGAAGHLKSYKLMHESQPTNPMLEKHKPFFRRALFTVGLLLRYFDFGDEQVHKGLNVSNGKSRLSEGTASKGVAATSRKRDTIVLCVMTIGKHLPGSCSSASRPPRLLRPGGGAKIFRSP